MPTMTPDRLDAMRGGVLQQMERADRNVKRAIVAAAVVELVLFAVVLLAFDVHDPLARLVFVTAVLSYTIVALGLLALGAHVTRTVGRLVALLDTRDDARDDAR